MVWSPNLSDNPFFVKNSFRQPSNPKADAEFCSDNPGFRKARTARRIGKSTLAEQFARNEYRSYIQIDFARASAEVHRLFDDVSDLDFLFLQLQLRYGVQLFDREPLVIFDEVQLCPPARQAIKYLVKNGRYDFLETGSLISIKKNTKDILIPSEETKNPDASHGLRRVSMGPRG